MITADEKMVLLELARQVASLADGPQNEEKRELWLKHNTAHQTTMPSILLMNYFSYCVSPNLGLIF